MCKSADKVETEVKAAIMAEARAENGLRELYRSPRAMAMGNAFTAVAGGTGVGAVARMNCSSAATTAAASSGVAPGATIESLGRRFIGADDSSVGTRRRAREP